MNEAEWLTGTDAVGMLRFVREFATDRQYRLFAVACARDELDRARETGELRNFGDRLPQGLKLYWDPVRGYEAAILGSEARADGREVRWGWSSMWFVGWGKGIDGVDDIAYAALGYDPDGNVAVPPEQIERTIQSYRTHPTHYLRDIFGNPFRASPLSPEWRTSTVVAVARNMYESRDFSPIALLADALEDAGCASEEVVNHCRSAGPHVRGCWVIESILEGIERGTPREPPVLPLPEAPAAEINAPRRPWWKFWA
jgi:hypothetical protein